MYPFLSCSPQSSPSFLFSSLSHGPCLSSFYLSPIFSAISLPRFGAWGCLFGRAQTQYAQKHLRDVCSSRGRLTGSSQPQFCGRWPLAARVLACMKAGPGWRLRANLGTRYVEVSIHSQRKYLRLKESLRLCQRAGGRSKIIEAARQSARKFRKRRNRHGILKRWYGQFKTAKNCRPLAAGAGRSARVFLVVVANHNGFGLTVWKKQLSCALCHSGVRQSARPGDLVLAVSSVSTCYTRVWPEAYRRAIKRRGDRVLAAGFQVRKCVPFEKYHAGHWRHRPDSAYRPRQAGDGGRKWKDKRGQWWVLHKSARRGTKHEYGSRDLQGQVLLSSWYFRAGVDLQHAPTLPAFFSAELSRWPGRNYKLVTHKTRLHMWKWFKKVSPAAGGVGAL